MLSDEDKKDVAQLIAAAMQSAAPAATPVPEPEHVPSPEFYVHLADGRVIETEDGQSTHMDGVMVIGRYPKGE
jgi:hypothetical protein